MELVQDVFDNCEAFTCEDIGQYIAYMKWDYNGAFKDVCVLSFCEYY